MVVVAVSGGTGKLGRAIVEAIVKDGGHSVKVLARNPNPELAKELGAPIIPVDYANVDSLTKTLDDNGIHTIICTLAIMGEVENKAQLNLIQAADNSSTTKRFAPSEFGILFTAEHAQSLLVALAKLQAVDALKKTKLEYTLFANGWFLDYYGLPHVKSYFEPLTLALDVAGKAAAIPGSGDAPVVFTHTFDVAKFVSASLDLAKWPEKSVMIGDRVTWNEFLKQAEEARGTKFDVTYDSFEKLQTYQVTELPSHKLSYAVFPKENLQYMMSLFGIWSAKGDFDASKLSDDTLNARFPDIKPMTVKDILTAWKGK